MNTVIRSILSLSFLLFVLNSFAQKKDIAVKQFLENKQFVFKANTALPASGSSRFITSDYGLTLKGDTLVSYLPYFGRAYTAQIGSSRSPLDFTSTKFTYDLKPKKKGGWELHIKPVDQRDVRQFFLSVSEKGNAMLQVLSNDRQPISFNGYIAQKEK
jgi:hypothetical protein